MTFTSVFGGSTLQPAQVAYRAVALTANVTLVWPAYSKTLTDFAARTMDVTPSGPGLSLGMPPANAVSTGFDLLISNKGGSAFTLTDNLGNTIVVVNAGVVKYIQVTDNSTQAGVWSNLTFGAATSTADASALAGAGLSVNGAFLQASRTLVGFSAPMTIGVSDRAKIYNWTGGVGTQTLPLANTVGIGSDFFYEVRNSGSGTLTLAASGADTIDGSASISLQPTESCIVHSNGPTGVWLTVGRGRSTQFNFSLLIKNAVGGTTMLSTTEAANIVQRYTGVLASNATIVLPSVVQVYYVSNQTSGAFTLTFKTSGVGTTVVVPTNQQAVLFCDGLNVINNSTTISGTSALSLIQGSVGVPSLSIIGDLTTGLYQPAGGSLAVTISGVQRAVFDGNGVALANRFASGSGNVTSSTNSVAMGVNNTASNAAAIALGFGNTASNAAAVALGSGCVSGTGTNGEGAITAGFGCTVDVGVTGIARNGIALGYGAHTFGVARLVYSGSGSGAQASLLTLLARTTDATPKVATVSDVGAQTYSMLTLQNFQAITFSGLVTARQKGSDGTSSAAWYVQGLIRREANAASTVLVAGAAPTAISNVPGWGLALTADTARGALAMTFTGAGATNIQMSARLDTNDCLYA